MNSTAYSKIMKLPFQKATIDRLIPLLETDDLVLYTDYPEGIAIADCEAGHDDKYRYLVPPISDDDYIVYTIQLPVKR